MTKLVTVEEARQILGNDADEMSDDELQDLIIHLTTIAKWAINESVCRYASTEGRSKNDATEV